MCFFFLIIQNPIWAQDSITIQDLEKFSYSFNIVDGKFQGEGAQILTKAIAETHITMLAENVGSKLEHHFTNALINELDRNNYKKMVLESGGGSSQLINKMAKNGTLTIPHIKAFNQKYLLDKKGRIFPPIPELKTVEALQFLQNANNRGWHFLSVGIESWTSYNMFADELFANLLPKNQQAHRQLFEEVKTFLDQQYKIVNAHNSEEVYNFISQIKSSKSFNKFLEKMTVCEGNKETIKAIQKSIEYYWMYGNKQFYEKNMWSAKQDKIKLAGDLKKENFDFSKDKLFVKMWWNHLSKGHANFGAYGIGNMLQELIEYHGNQSLVIGVFRRYHKEGDEVKDMLESSDRFTKSNYEMVQLGKEKEWILIDLRPFNKEFYYGAYFLSESLYKMMVRYDILIIPKTDEPATLNY